MNGMIKLVAAGSIVGAITISSAIEESKHAPSPELLARYDSYKQEMIDYCADGRATAELCGCVIENAEKHTILPKEQQMKTSYMDYEDIRVADVINGTVQEHTDAYYRGQYRNYMKELRERKLDDKDMDDILRTFYNEMEVNTAGHLIKGCSPAPTLETHADVKKSGIMYHRTETAAKRMQRLAEYKRDQGHTQKVASNTRTAPRASVNTSHKKSAAPQLRR